MSDVRSYYDAAWADEAVAEALALERHRREAISRAFSLLGDVRGRSLLEVGPGSGRAAARLRAAGARLVAADLSSSALGRTRAAAPLARLVQADLERLPFRPRSFDRVLVNSLLMFVDADRAAAEIGRSLRRDGAAVVVEPLSGNPVMALYRAATGRYRRIARWHALERLRAAFRPRFGRVEEAAYYLVPPAALLEGRARRLARAAEAFLLALAPGLARFAWVAVFRLSRPVDTVSPKP